MPVIDRNLAAVLLERTRHYPVVTVTDPRQSGKTTLCRTVFPDRPYVSLVRHNTIRAWLSVLEASFLAMRVPAHRSNLRKRRIKAPKLHFLDSGLACHLLGIRSAGELRHHPLRGAIFESWVASEVFKAVTHRGEQPRLGHYRAAGTEVDLVIDLGTRIVLAEAKSGATVTPRFFGGMRRLGGELENAGFAVERRLVYGGEVRRSRGGAEVVPWDRLPELEW